MKPITGEILINAPREIVFDFVANESNEPLYNPGMLRATQVTPAPIGVGTRFTAVMDGHRCTTVTIEYTGFNRPYTLSSLSRTKGMDIDGQLTFTAEGNRTRLTWVWRLRPRGALRLLAPLVGALGRRQEHNNWTALKTYLDTTRNLANSGEDVA